ncbi:MAG: hypothetical protein ABIQ88_03430 [Chitinophagaceae bacterium]
MTKARFRQICGICAILIFLPIAVYYSRKGPLPDNSIKAGRKVTIQHINGRYAFYKDNKPFLVKGGAGYTFIKDLALSGGNTIICWDTAALQTTLNQAAEYNLSVIIGLDIPGVQYPQIYKNKKKLAELFSAYSVLVDRYKDHPAVFAWCLGNELIFPFSPVYDPFYTAYNRLLGMIHRTDPNHPVCTTVINVSRKNIFNIQWRVPAIDFIGLNSYYSIRTLQQDISQLKLFWKGPYIISEWAPLGTWEAPVTSWGAPIEKNSTEKAQEYTAAYVDYIAPLNDRRFLGSLAFYWGSRQEYTFTWYSVFNEDGVPTEMKEALNDCWTDSLTKHSSPELRQILFDGNLSAKDNIMVSAGTLHKADVFLKAGNSPDSVRCCWQVLKEDWALWGKPWDNFKKPARVAGLLADSLQHTSFTAPEKEGPYRLFVTVYNSKGYCATTNIPFYVLE